MDFSTAEERGLTPLEAWRAVEEFEIDLGPPRLCGGRWLAVWKGEAADGGIRRVLEFGDTPIQAIENVLREIGGEHGR